MVARVQACVQTQAPKSQPVQPAITGAPQSSGPCDSDINPAVARVLEGPAVSTLQIRQPNPAPIPVVGPRGENQYDTVGGTRISAIALDEYYPETTPRPLVLKDRKLDRYLRRFDKGAARNAENMDRAAVWSQIQEWATRETSEAALVVMDVTDLAHLSPRQAMLLATLITQDTLFYDRELATGAGFSLAGIGRFFRIHDVLSWPVERFFSEGGATCREYADVAHAVFEVLKDRQDPESSQLVNSYMKLPTTHDHVWNALYTVQPNGEVHVTQVDVSWMDTGEAGRLADNLDHTFGVRDYWRQMALLEGTGKRPLRELLRRFEDRTHVRHDRHAPKEITNRSIRRNGGLPALVRAFDALPEPLQLLALERMDRRVRAQVIDDRAARGLVTATEEPAQH